MLLHSYSSDPPYANQISHPFLSQPTWPTHQIGFTFFLNRCSESLSASVAKGVLLNTCQNPWIVFIGAISFSWSAHSSSVASGLLLAPNKAPVSIIFVCIAIQRSEWLQVPSALSSTHRSCQNTHSWRKGYGRSFFSIVMRSSARFSTGVEPPRFGDAGEIGVRSVVLRGVGTLGSDMMAGRKFLRRIGTWSRIEAEMRSGCCTGGELMCNT